MRQSPGVVSSLVPLAAVSVEGLTELRPLEHLRLAAALRALALLRRRVHLLLARPVLADLQS